MAALRLQVPIDNYQPSERSRTATLGPSKSSAQMVRVGGRGTWLDVCVAACTLLGVPWHPAPCSLLKPPDPAGSSAASDGRLNAHHHAYLGRV